jgi:hypothetical protein
MADFLRIAFIREGEATQLSVRQAHQLLQRKYHVAPFGMKSTSARIRHYNVTLRSGVGTYQGSTTSNLALTRVLLEKRINTINALCLPWNPKSHYSAHNSQTGTPFSQMNGPHFPSIFISDLFSSCPSIYAYLFQEVSSQ